VLVRAARWDELGSAVPTDVRARLAAFTMVLPLGIQCAPGASGISFGADKPLGKKAPSSGSGRLRLMADSGTPLPKRT
jgi:hypothetical protein